MESDEFFKAITVTLTCDREEAVIWYTINGGDPKCAPNAIIYTEPFTISDNAELEYYDCFCLK